ncbi:MAG TPA: prepilin-type N-terminal cleavage/methylation domain-containing protein [Phycisphaerales bacterium]|nr:prepilin-type N-terminal cleavage/methylation domain-containing protein [Phycisphaerales bacterium]
MTSRGIVRRGFSLIELVIVIVIIGIIAAIAIPRMSRGAEGASDSALVANLAVLRNAIDLYTTEHEGLRPTAASIETQLLTYSKLDGTTQATKDTSFIYGPYLRAIPPMPITGNRRGATGIAAADAVGVGWLYNETTGAITSNTGVKTDAKGVLYTSY